MKQLTILIAAILSLSVAFGQQDFKTYVSTAKTSYSAGKLEDAHFALQQMLQDVEITIGKEVLKLLPAKMDTLNSVAQEDNVTGNISFVGATIHRTYGSGEKRAQLDIINNSPLLGALNAFLTTPMLGGLMNDGKSKTVKVQGYKARLEKEDDGGYKLEIPFNSALITYHVDKSTDTEILAMANTIPLPQIAKLIQ
jgi:hypothetical protein